MIDRAARNSYRRAALFLREISAKNTRCKRCKVNPEQLVSAAESRITCQPRDDAIFIECEVCRGAWFPERIGTRVRDRSHGVKQSRGKGN